MKKIKLTFEGILAIIEDKSSLFETFHEKDGSLISIKNKQNGEMFFIDQRSYVEDTCKGTISFISKK